MDACRVPSSFFSNSRCHLCKGEFDEGDNFPVAHLKKMGEDDYEVVYQADHPVHYKCIEDWFEVGKWMDLGRNCPFDGCNGLIGRITITDNSGAPLSWEIIQDDGKKDTTSEDAKEDPMEIDDSLETELGKGLLMQMSSSAYLHSLFAENRFDEAMVLLQGNHNLTSQERGVALEAASLIPHAGIVGLLLSGGNVDQVFLDQAVYHGSSLNSPGVVSLVLEKGIISDGARAYSLVAAAENGGWEIVQRLLSLPGKVSHIALSRAIIGATKKGYSGIVSLLLRHSELDPYTHAEALLESAKGNHFKIAEELMKTKSNMGEIVLGSALVHVAKHRNANFVKALLSYGKAGEYSVGKAVKIAAANGDKEIIFALLQEQVGEYDLGQALILTIQNVNYRTEEAIVQRLLEFNAISIEVINQAIEIAIEDGEDVLVVLLERYKTSY